MTGTRWQGSLRLVAVAARFIRRAIAPGRQIVPQLYGPGFVGGPCVIPAFERAGQVGADGAAAHTVADTRCRQSPVTAPINSISTASSLAQMAVRLEEPTAALELLAATAQLSAVSRCLPLDAPRCIFYACFVAV